MEEKSRVDKKKELEYNYKGKNDIIEIEEAVGRIKIKDKAQKLEDEGQTLRRKKFIGGTVECYMRSCSYCNPKWQPRKKVE